MLRSVYASVSFFSFLFYCGTSKWTPFLLFDLLLYFCLAQIRSMVPLISSISYFLSSNYSEKQLLASSQARDSSPIICLYLCIYSSFPVFSMVNCWKAMLSSSISPYNLKTSYEVLMISCWRWEFEAECASSSLRINLVFLYLSQFSMPRSKFSSRSMSGLKRQTMVLAAVVMRCWRR